MTIYASSRSSAMTVAVALCLFGCGSNSTSDFDSSALGDVDLAQHLDSAKDTPIPTDAVIDLWDRPIDTASDQQIPDVPFGNPIDTMPDAVSCGNGKSIHYTSPGCGAAAVPVCDSPTYDACAMVVWYCSCDGVTGVVGGCGTSNVPFLYAGPCKRDAGVSVLDAMGVD